MSLREKIQFVLDNFPNTREHYNKLNKKERKMKDWPAATSLSKEIPELFRSRYGSSLNIKGSAGQMNMAEVPHVCLFDKEITISPQKGYYIAYLFSADGSRVYLSLNQGWTEFKRNAVKADDVNNAVTRTTLAARQVLNANEKFSYSEIQLLAKGELGAGYEQTNICSRVYYSNQIPPDIELFEDLDILVSIYRDLKAKVGRSLIDYAMSVDEMMFQESIQTAEPVEEDTSGPQPKPEKSETFGFTRWKRNPGRAAAALKRASYLCEYDEKHITFISRRSDHNFVEAHHLVPLEFQELFAASLDVVQNIISLCPNCHRAIHHSHETKKREMITKFFAKRESELLKMGILVDVKKLFNFYDTMEKADDGQ